MLCDMLCDRSPMDCITGCVLCMYVRLVCMTYLVLFVYCYE